MNVIPDGTVIRCAQVPGDTVQLRYNEDGTPFLDVRTPWKTDRITICLSRERLETLQAEIDAALAVS